MEDILVRRRYDKYLLEIILYHFLELSSIFLNLFVKRKSKWFDDRYKNYTLRVIFLRFWVWFFFSNCTITGLFVSTCVEQCEV